MARHKKPRKVLPRVVIPRVRVKSRAGIGVLCALALVAAGGTVMTMGGGGASTPKAIALSGKQAASTAHVTVYACLSMDEGRTSGISTSEPKCPTNSDQVKWQAKSGPAATASTQSVLVYACLSGKELSGVSVSAPTCPTDTVRVHWAVEDAPATAPAAVATPALASMPASSSPSPSTSPTPSDSASPSVSPSADPSASPTDTTPSSPSSSPSPSPSPSASTPSSAPTTAPTAPSGPVNRTQCTSNQGGGPNDSVTSLDGGEYHLQANEWNSSATFTICTDGGPDFTISTSGVDVAHDGAPGAYPSIYKGCHWGYCTTGSGMPVAVSAMASTPDKVTTTYDTTTVANGAWDDSYDIWYNPAATTSSNNTGLEMMIWLNHFGGTQPAGSPGPTVTLDGIGWTVWYGGSGDGGTVSYVANAPMSSVNNLDLGPLAAYAVSKGYMQNSWYLIDVEAGFEPWTSGQGLTADDFNVTVR